MLPSSTLSHIKACNVQSAESPCQALARIFCPVLAFAGSTTKARSASQHLQMHRVLVALLLIMMAHEAHVRARRHASVASMLVCNTS